MLDKRVKGGVVQYKIEWKSWNNRYNCWRDQSDLESVECQELIDKYEEAHLGLGQPEVMQCVLALMVSLATAGAVSDSGVQQAMTADQLQGYDVEEAVSD